MQTQDEKQGNRQRTWLIGAVVLGFVNLGGLGLLAARAMSGVSGGKTKDLLTFAGTLKGISGTPMLAFTFKKAGSQCEPPQVIATPDSNGVFSVDLDIGQCPASLFDGSDVTLDVAVGGVPIATGQPINPVPYARYADRVGSPDCPVGYEKDPKESTGSTVVCRKGLDEMVKVGIGASAFWIDRYEASVYASSDGSGMPLNLKDPTLQDKFPPNGHWTGMPPAYALSRAGVVPSGLSWFQAIEACAASGKRLPGRQEWLRAVRKTRDPGRFGGDNGTCNMSSKGSPRPSGMGTECVSEWGAQDMIGNQLEWTDEWYAGVGIYSGDGMAGKLAAQGQTPWPVGFSLDNQDATYNITTHVTSGPGVETNGMPAAALRGGDWTDGANGGAFALKLVHGPSFSDPGFGFRCVIPR